MHKQEKSTLIDGIRNGKIKEVLSTLQQHPEYEHQKREILVLESRYNRLMKQQQLGIITTDQYDADLNKVTLDLYQLVEGRGEVIEDETGKRILPSTFIHDFLYLYKKIKISYKDEPVFIHFISLFIFTVVVIKNKKIKVHFNLFNYNENIVIEHEDLKFESDLIIETSYHPIYGYIREMKFLLA